MRHFYKQASLLFALLWFNGGAIAANDTLEPFTLQQAVDYAHKHNPNLQIMQERIGQAQAQLGEALSAFYPQVNVRLGYEHTDNPARAFAMIISQRRLDFANTNFNHPGGVDNYRPEVSAQYSLFRGGQDYYASKAAESAVVAATLDEAAIKNQLTEWVTSAFYAYLAALENHKVSLRSIEAVASELKQSKIRYDAGTELKSDVLSLEVQLAAAQDNEIHAANASELILTSLKTLLGLNSEQTFTIDTKAGHNLPKHPDSFNQLLADALAKRPELKAAEKRLEMADKQLRAAQGAYLPTANAYVNYGSDSKNLDFSTNRDNVSAGVMVQMNLFSGFRDSERINKAKHQLSIAKRQLTQTRLNIEKEVKSARLKLKEALNRLTVTTASVASAEEALRMVKAQRDAGTVTVTRYIEAEVARDQAHARKIAAYYDALRAKAQLNQAVGY